MTIEALTRLEQAFDGNKIGKDSKSHKQDVLYSLSEALQYWMLGAPVKQIATLKGGFTVYHYKDKNGDNTFLLNTPKELFPIGLLYTNANYDKIQETNMSWVQKEYQGKGLGPAMYEAALKHFGYLASSTSLSPGSSKLWQRLVLKHKGRLVIPAMYSPTKKPIQLPVIGWETVKDIVYPILQTDKGPKSLNILGNKRKGLEGIAASESYYLLYK